MATYFRRKKKGTTRKKKYYLYNWRLKTFLAEETLKNCELKICWATQNTLRYGGIRIKSFNSKLKAKRYIKKNINEKWDVSIVSNY